MDYRDQVCSKCGVRCGDRIMKYCGDGSDKDNDHRWVYPEPITPPSDGQEPCTPNRTDPACPDCGAVDCNRAFSSNQKCSSGFEPGAAKVCERCGRLACDGPVVDPAAALAEALEKLIACNDQYQRHEMDYRHVGVAWENTRAALETWKAGK